MPRSAQKSYSSNRLLSGPKRDGLMLTIRGCHAIASTSSTEWIGASQVMRSLTGSRIGLRLVVHVRVLEPGVRERLDQHPVQLRVGLHVHRRALVLALEVERVDGAGRGQRLDQLVAPAVGGVELKRVPG